MDIMQIAIQAATAEVRVMREADMPAELQTSRSLPEEQHRPRQAVPMLSQSAFDWEVPDRYVEILNFEMKVTNVLQAKVCDLSDKEKVPIIENQLDKEELQIIQTLTNAEKETCNSTTGLFTVFKEKFRPRHNEMILPLQCCKWHRKENESTQEWMDRCHIKAPECNYKEHDR